MQVVYYETNKGFCPVKEFIHNIDVQIASKAYSYFLLLAQYNGSLRSPFSKHLGNGIFELRPSRRGMAVRVLYFFDTNDVAVLTNAFIKKQDKTPSAEVELAKSYRKDYYSRKDL